MSHRMFGTLFRDLRSLAVNNIEYFQDGTSSHHARFHQAFCILHEHLDRGIQPALEGIAPILHKYDLSPDTQANGYRSLIKVIHKCCIHLLQLSRYINVNRNSLFFRGSHYSKELDAYVTVLGQLRACIHCAQNLVNYCEEGSLFANEDELNNPIAEKLMQEVEMLNQECFYGRCLGFQFCESMQRPLLSVGVAMASFSEGYQEASNVMQLATSVFNSGKYIMNPELRAQQIVNVTRTADVQFCKAFWSITESDIMQQMPSFVSPTVQVNEVLSLPPENFDLPPEDPEVKEMITITPPCAHTGHGPVHCRLISFERREGQEVSKTKRVHTKPMPMSSCLLIHCHGGGFVAQSSRSHEVYTRHWAKDLNVPILSLDYSLSPENPFPRALEECFYAYAWAIKNAEKLGWTGDTVCLTGDSAGANLMVSVAMRAGSYGIKVPDGIVAVYPAVMVRYAPSPSRVLGLMDPLLPVGILARCLAAYAGVADKIPSVTTPPEQPELDIDSFVILDADDFKDLPSDTTEQSSTSCHEQSTKEGQGTWSNDLATKHNDMSLTSKCHSLDNLTEEEYQYQAMDTTEANGESELKSDLTAKCNNMSLTSKCHSLDDLLEEEYKYQTIDSTEMESNLNGNKCKQEVKDDLETPKELEGTEFHNISLDNERENNQMSESEIKQTVTSQNSEDLPDSGINSDSESCRIEKHASSAPPHHTCLSDPGDLQSGHVTEKQDCTNSDMKFPVSGESTSNQTQDLKAPLCSDSMNLDLINPITHLHQDKIKTGVKSESSCNHQVKKVVRSPSVPEISVSMRSGQSKGKFSPVLSSPRHIQYSPIAMFRHLPIVKNPYMSPLLAPEDMLRRLPPIHLVACHLDPLLDDAVMFAKRLRGLDLPVDLHLIDDLPHGFLNFVAVSKEAKLAADVCAGKIRQVLGH